MPETVSFLSFFTFQTRNASPWVWMTRDREHIELDASFGKFVFEWF